jgi:hypothetical protein
LPWEIPATFEKIHGKIFSQERGKLEKRAKNPISTGFKASNGN